MAEIRNSICLTSVAYTVSEIMGVEKSENSNPVLLSLAEKKLQGRKADRAVLYNPDAVALWLYQKYTELFTDAVISSDIALPVLSVMPSVTPVCFASMYSGVMPSVHGIQKYEKPVLTVNTLFDTFIRAGKKCAIVSTARDSISCIFLEREMDYFIYESVEEVNEKALQLIDEDAYDLIVIYNGNYDGTMHKFGPESNESISALKHNITFYKELTDKIKAQWKNHDVLYGFLPDHGCHEIDGECGSHGLDMEEDMNIIHFYGIKTKE
ncbi:MAG: hypothetical protein E7555_09155 [Ruminococcaceae bacterium]|nr:hypothetical protein [Oscillospiraceae bacterium]